MQIAPGLHRIGRGHITPTSSRRPGWVTIVDAGLRRFWRFLPGELATMGRTIEDVRAIVLTHAHADHIGFAERERRDHGIPIRVHGPDAAHACGEEKLVGGYVRPWRPGPIPRFVIQGIWNGGPSSLTRLHGIEAGLVLPGHGEPWTSGVAAAVEEARSRP